MAFRCSAFGQQLCIKRSQRTIFVELFRMTWGSLILLAVDVVTRRGKSSCLVQTVQQEELPYPSAYADLKWISSVVFVRIRQVVSYRQQVMWTSW
jgi:hypothetical protein